jgi:hypothetical protein
MHKAVLILLLLPSLAWAHPCPDAKDTKRVHVKAHTRSYPKKTAPAPVVVVEKDCYLDRVKEGFALTAGFRWDKECPTCPPVSCGPTPRPNHHDPAFVGAELRVPLDPHFTAFGNYDRDLVEGPDWNARVGLSYHPWRKN